MVSNAGMSAHRLLGAVSLGVLGLGVTGVKGDWADQGVATKLIWLLSRVPGVPAPGVLNTCRRGESYPAGCRVVFRVPSATLQLLTLLGLACRL